MIFGAIVLLERPKTRAPGIVASVIAVYVLILMVWSFALHGARFNILDSTTGLVPFLVAAILIARLLHTQHSRLAGTVGLFVLFSAIAVFHLTTFVRNSLPWRDYVSQRIAMEFGLLGLLTVGCLIGLDRPFSRAWRWLGVAAALLAVAVSVYRTWQYSYGYYWSFYADMPVFTLSVFVAALACEANLIYCFALPRRFLWLSRGVLAVGVVVALTVTSVSIFGGNYYHHQDSFLIRLAGSGMVTNVCGMIALAFISYYVHSDRRNFAPSEIANAVLACPMCDHRQTLAAGQTTACESCGLWMQVNIAEPRCASCDYLLYHVKGSTCPECGQAIDITPAFSGSITSTSLGA